MLMLDRIVMWTIAATLLAAMLSGLYTLQNINDRLTLVEERQLTKVTKVSLTKIVHTKELEELRATLKELRPKLTALSEQVHWYSKQCLEPNKPKVCYLDILDELRGY